jgi:hypothetical protein
MPRQRGTMFNLQKQTGPGKSVDLRSRDEIERRCCIPPELNTPRPATCQQPFGYRVERTTGSKCPSGARHKNSPRIQVTPVKRGVSPGRSLSWPPVPAVPSKENCRDGLPHSWNPSPSVARISLNGNPIGSGGKNSWPVTGLTVPTVSHLTSSKNRYLQARKAGYAA